MVNIDMHVLKIAIVRSIVLTADAIKGKRGLGKGAWPHHDPERPARECSRGSLMSMVFAAGGDISAGSCAAEQPVGREGGMQGAAAAERARAQDGVPAWRTATCAR